MAAGRRPRGNGGGVGRLARCSAFVGRHVARDAWSVAWRVARHVAHGAWCDAWRVARCVARGAWCDAWRVARRALALPASMARASGMPTTVSIGWR
eukprot:2787575-Prymnesium_polylepis.2